MSAYAPSHAARQPLYSMQPQPRSTAADTTDEEEQSLSLRDKDNFDRIASIAREAYDATRVIMGELNVEQKMYQYAPTQTTALLNTLGAFPVINWANGFGAVCLNQIPQNVNEAGRTGDSIKMTNLMFDIRVASVNGTWATNEVDYAKLIIFYCPGPTTATVPFGTTASATDGLLEFSYGSTVLAPFAPKDYDGNSKPRVKIVHEHLFRLTAEHPQLYHHALIKLDKKTQFENDGNTINTGFLGFMIIGDAGSFHCTATTAWRLYFVDN